MFTEPLNVFCPGDIENFPQLAHPQLYLPQVVRWCDTPASVMA